MIFIFCTEVHRDSKRLKMMVYKSREVQKTVWKSHKATRVIQKSREVIRLIHKSREVHKTIWKSHKATRVM